MATRQRIVDAALLTFGRYGYRQASMEAVAEQAALSRQALYRHFPTKEALFAAVVEDLHGSALAAAAGAAQEAREQGGDATAVLLAQLEARFATILARLHGSAHAEELQDENSRQCGAIAAEAGRRFVAQLAATIRAERRAGRLALPRGLAAGALAESLVAAARGIKAAVPPPSADAFRRELGADGALARGRRLGSGGGGAPRAPSALPARVGGCGLRGARAPPPPRGAARRRGAGGAPRPCAPGSPPRGGRRSSRPACRSRGCRRGCRRASATEKTKVEGKSLDDDTKRKIDPYFDSRDTGINPSVVLTATARRNK